VRLSLDVVALGATRDLPGRVMSLVTKRRSVLVIWCPNNKKKAADTAASTDYKQFASEEDLTQLARRLSRPRKRKRIAPHELVRLACDARGLLCIMKLGTGELRDVLEQLNQPKIHWRRK